MILIFVVAIIFLIGLNNISIDVYVKHQYKELGSLVGSTKQSNPHRTLYRNWSTNSVKGSVGPFNSATNLYKHLSSALLQKGNRESARVYFEEGNAAQKTQEWQRAKAAYIEAANADPTWFDAWFELGQAAFYTGDTDLALQAFENALAIHPNDGPARFNFAMSLLQGGHYADAAREFENFLRFHPDNAHAHFEAGKLYADKLNEAAKANIHYKRVIGLDPDHPQAVAIRYWLIRNKVN